MGKRRPTNGKGKKGESSNGARDRGFPLKGFSLKNLENFLAVNRGRAVAFGCAALGLVLLVGLIAFLARPRMLWYVDEDVAAAWNRFLRDAVTDADNGPPVARFEVRSRAGDSPFPRGRFGFMVSLNGPAGNRAPETPVTVYPELSRTRALDGWRVLALDPWMVFRRHYVPEPTRAFLDGSRQRGSLLLAGNDPRAVLAWTGQLLQESPGVFSRGEELWREKAESLVRDYPFQSGAFTFTWMHVWHMFFRDEAAFLYAPLSQARDVAHTARHHAGFLDATVFPTPTGWSGFGLQAELLWARPHSRERRRGRLEATERWLESAWTQTQIANELEWIPAHPEGEPFNTVSMQSQIAWLRSSYVWRGTETSRAYRPGAFGGQ